jgi:hypothetical protein
MGLAQPLRMRRGWATLTCYTDVHRENGNTASIIPSHFVLNLFEFSLIMTRTYEPNETYELELTNTRLTGSRGVGLIHMGRRSSNIPLIHRNRTTLGQPG